MKSPLQRAESIPLSGGKIASRAKMYAKCILCAGGSLRGLFELRSTRVEGLQSWLWRNTPDLFLLFGTAIPPITEASTRLLTMAQFEALLLIRTHSISADDFFALKNLLYQSLFHLKADLAVHCNCLTATSAISIKCTPKDYESGL